MGNTFKEKTFTKDVLISGTDNRNGSLCSTPISLHGLSLCNALFYCALGMSALQCISISALQCICISALQCIGMSVLQCISISALQCLGMSAVQ